MKSEFDGKPDELIKPEKKFSDADMVGWYALLYSTFSGISHGNLLSLIQEYTCIEDDVVVISMNNDKIEEIVPLCDVLFSSVYRIMETIVKILNVPPIERIKKLDSIVKEFREEYMCSTGST